MTVQQCFATKDQADKGKKGLKKTIQDQIKNVQNHGILIVMEYMNAKVGEKNVGFESHMDKHEIGITVDNRFWTYVRKII